MPITEEKLKKLETLFRVVDESLTKEEFLSAFESIIKQIMDIEKQLIQKIDRKTSQSSHDISLLEANLIATIDTLEKESSKSLTDLLSKTNLFKQDCSKENFFSSLNFKPKSSIPSIRRNLYKKVYNTY